MHTTAEPIKLDYEDYCALPNDGKRYEILDGDLFVSPSPETPHQSVVGNLHAALHTHVRAKRIGRVFVAPFDVLLSKHNIVEPDIIFVSVSRKSIITPRNIEGSPDLLIEVLSPSTSKRDLREKRNIYARTGVMNYWIIDPVGQFITEFALEGESYREIGLTRGTEVFKPTLFPGLEIAPDGLWE